MKELIQLNCMIVQIKVVKRREIFQLMDNLIYKTLKLHLLHQEVLKFNQEAQIQISSKLSPMWSILKKVKSKLKNKIINKSM